MGYITFLRPFNSHTLTPQIFFRYPFARLSKKVIDILSGSWKKRKSNKKESFIQNAVSRFMDKELDLVALTEERQFKFHTKNMTLL